MARVAEGLTPPSPAVEEGGTPAPAPPRNSLGSPGPAGARLWGLLLALTFVAAVPRLVALDSLSFYSDEDLSAYAGRSVAEGRGSVLPSGLDYRRGLPFTWAMAASTRLFGPEKEASYRLPAALLGALTVPLLFTIGRRWVGWEAALLAAALLAVSEWHLAFSRQARMYAPLVFLSLAAAYFGWRWAYTRAPRDLLVAAVALTVAGSLHLLAVPAALFPLLAFGSPAPESSPRRSWPVVGFAALGALFVAVYDQRVVRPAYVTIRAPERPPPLSLEAEAGTTATTALGDLFGFLPARIAALPPWVLALVVAGAALGAWFWWRTSRGADAEAGSSLRSGARLLLALVGGAAMGLGQIYAGALCALVFLLLSPVPRRRLLKGARMPLLLLGALAAAWLVAAVAREGFEQGVKFVLLYPFPYPFFFLLSMPGVVLAFLAVCLWLAARPARPGEAALRACALMSLLVFASVGLAREWGGSRYLLPVYPFLLLTSAAGLLLALRLAARRFVPGWPSAALWVGLAVVASGALGAHGIPRAVAVVSLDHGEPVDSWMHTYPFRPDHERPGAFVRAERGADDVIIAEDPLQQRWYAGPVDLWFRRYGDARRYLTRGEDGLWRDIYVGSAILPEPPRVDSIACAVLGRVWLITSGETVEERTWYLSPEQRRWLDSLERAQAPAFTGRDGVTRVFCWRCAATGRATACESPAR